MYIVNRFKITHFSRVQWTKINIAIVTCRYSYYCLFLKNEERITYQELYDRIIVKLEITEWFLLLWK